MLKEIDARYKLVCLVPPDTDKRYKLKDIRTSVFGDKLYDYIYSSKVVINIHYYESILQEQVRLFELLINKVKILSEVSRRNYYPGLIEEFNNKTEMLNKISSIINPKTFEKPYRVGVAYNTFYGLKQIESSINSIRSAVDYIVVVHQREGINGVKEPEYNQQILDRLDVDDIVYVDVNMNNIEDFIIHKRNLGLEYCKINNCDYIMPMDTDEEYNADLLKTNIREMYIKGIQTLYSPILSFYGDRQHYFKDTYYVPSIYKIDHRKFGMCKSTILSDPCRKMPEDKYLISEMPMLHYTYIKEYYDEKIDKSLFVKYGLQKNIIKINNHLQNWEEGDNALVHHNDKSGVLILDYVELKKSKDNNISIKRTIQNTMSVGLVYGGRCQGLLDKWITNLITDIQCLESKPELIIINNTNEKLEHRLSNYQNHFKEILIIQGETIQYNTEQEKREKLSVLLAKSYNTILNYSKGDILHLREDDNLSTEDNGLGFVTCLDYLLNSGVDAVSGAYYSRRGSWNRWIGGNFSNNIAQSNHFDRLPSETPFNVDFCGTGYLFVYRDRCSRFSPSVMGLNSHDMSWGMSMKQEGKIINMMPNVVVRHYINDNEYVETPINNIKEKTRVRKPAGTRIRIRKGLH